MKTKFNKGHRVQTDEAVGLGLDSKKIEQMFLIYDAVKELKKETGTVEKRLPNRV